MERTYSQRLFNRFGSGQLEPDIRGSLAYRQASLRGRMQMQKMANMRLPLNTDPSRVRYEGSSYYTREPLYSAPMPQPFGTWGALSGLAAEDGTPVSTGKFSGYLPIPAPRQLSSQERANINEVDAREARRQRIRNATRRASIFPYPQPKPAYDLGESGNSPSMFSNYPIYGPNYL